MDKSFLINRLHSDLVQKMYDVQEAYCASSGERRTFFKLQRDYVWSRASEDDLRAYAYRIAPDIEDDQFWRELELARERYKSAMQQLPRYAA